MKTAVFFILFSFLFNDTYAQSKKYDSLWRKVDELNIKKGLPASALTEVKKIYALAKKEKQEAQQIKALLSQIAIEENLQENGDVRSILQLETEIKSAKEPISSILESVLAEKYRGYLQQHRWQLYGRTETVNFNKDNIESWTLTDFHRKITELYLASIRNEKLLQSTSLQTFEPMVVKGNTRNLRPTLFDLLSHRAIDYFRDSERDIMKPAYAFKINDPKAFAPAKDFINYVFTTADSLSLQHKALQVYQRILAFHINDQNPDALIDADIQRVTFVKQYAQMENKDTYYVSALNTIFNNYPSRPAADQALYLVAQWHREKATSYDPLKGDSNRYAYVEAKKIIDQLLKRSGESEGKVNAQNLLQQITQQQLNLNTEKVNVPGKPFRTLVNYRNITEMHFRLVALTPPLKRALRNRYDDKYWQQLLNLQPVKTWRQQLPATNDFQNHRVEIKIDALPVGDYLLLASGNQSFPLGKSPLAAQYFHVSNISYVSNQSDYFVLHRETGKPLAKATIQVWNDAYDYDVRQNTLRPAEKITADANGFFHMKPRAQRNFNIRFEITHNNDRLFLDDNEYGIFRARDVDNPENLDAATFEKRNASVYFFTDRSIYRPGQVVYFKGIAITKDFQTRKAKILSGHKTSVKLYDANGQVVDSLSVVTNDYGSYSGKFQLPENVLNGAFRIHDDVLMGETNVSVEEYKRPKFLVEYEPLKGTYKVNDSIQVNGTAKAYAGSNIAGAKVNFRVVREPRFLYPWLFRKWGYPVSEPMEITNGTTTTDEKGNFRITFKAIPDLSIKSFLDPIFDYRVIADITDINGETRSAEQIFPVGYKSLVVNIGLSDAQVVPADSLNKIIITTKNLNGIFQPSNITVQVSRLQVPSRMIRARYWETPDQFVMSRDEFISYFPTDEYQNESDHQEWSVAEKVLEVTDSSRMNSLFPLNPKKWADGWYLVEAITRDKDGGEVRDKAYIQVVNKESKTIPYPAYQWSVHENNVIEPGEKSAVTIGSTAEDLFVIRHIDKTIRTRIPRTNSNSDSLHYQFITMSNEKRTFVFEATEDDRGGYGVYHLYVKDNRFYTVTSVVQVPWTNKELRISYETFRDKTLPGSEEQWKIKISGYRNENVAAELLASMYDASLDQFKPHAWNTPGIWPVYSNFSRWSGIYNFQQVQSQERYVETGEWKSYEKNYERLYNPLSLWGERMYRVGNASGRDMMARKEVSSMAPPVTEQLQGVAPGVAVTATASKIVFDASQQDEKQMAPTQSEFQPRTNFNETAFFFPDLKTDAEGNITFSFTIPEALTRWKLQTLAYTKEAAFGLSSKDVVTQKELMVQPNAPRFLREGDRMSLSTRISNLSAKEITGTVHLELLDALTLKPVDGWFQNAMANQYFTVEAGQSVPVGFTIEVPYQYNSALLYRVIAKTTSTGADGITLSDGEEAILPVLTNSMLVTETLPLNIREGGTKQFTFEKLLNSSPNESSTLKHHALTVEFTTNPSWYAVQALPYLAEVKIESADHQFNRYYANALAFKIANTSPRILEIFEKWRTTDTAALLSNLQKNQELKSILLQETPWVLAAKTESQQKKNIALLFDMVRMSKELQSSLQLVKQMQTPNGGFPWFKGGKDDRFITQYILSGIGRLKKLGALPNQHTAEIQEITKAGVAYLDARIKEDYDQLIKNKADLKKNQISYIQVQYLYTRAFFSEHGIPGASFTAVNFYRKQAQTFWVNQSKYMQGMLALALHRTGDKNTATAIIKSLRENALTSEEMGMYWKDNIRGIYWYQAPVETHALLMEAFAEIENNDKTINDLKTWLLKQKQTQNWKTNKATADACYALLITSPVRENKGNWLTAQPAVEIRLGDKVVRSGDVKQEAGTGYFQTTFTSSQISPSMGNISVSVSPAGNRETAAPAWGAAYWQYFETLDKITPAATPLKLTKKLFVEKQSDRGPVLQPVTEGYVLHPGDKIKVRIELTVDRNMEYVHMKDMRASGMEPVNVISGYKWQGGLGYYETTKDASTSFFFNWLPKGAYVFEYPLFVAQAGNFSNGITTIQSMYAPEFSSHSEGVRVVVE